MKKKKLLMVLLVCTIVNVCGIDKNDSCIAAETYPIIIDDQNGVASGTYDNANGRVFEISVSGKLQVKAGSNFSNNGLIDGKVYSGRTILNSGTLNIEDNVSFVSNIGYYGGAIYNQGNSLLTAGNVSFLQNKALAGGFGGALLNLGTAILNQGNYFESNQGDYGGAIYNEGNIQITDNIFSSNIAAYSGGAIYNAANHSLQINDGEFNNNQAQAGGAIYSDESAVLNINGALFKENTANNRGGALYAYNANLQIDSTKFINNALTDTDNAECGGAIYYSNPNSDIISNITNSLFEGNKANSEGATGGALLFNYGKLNIDSTNFIANSASEGGAVYVALPKNKPNENLLSITNSNFKENTADATGGIFNLWNLNVEGSYFYKNESKSSEFDNGGGAMFLGSESKTSISDTIFEENTTNSSGGAIATRASKNGNNDTALLDIVNSTFKNNTAATSGGAIDNYFYKSATNSNAVTILNTVFEGNKATDGGAVYNHNIEQYGSDGKMLFSNSTFNANVSQNSGGAIYNATNAILSVTNGSFTNNSGNGENNGQGGGAIWNSGTITLTDSSLSGNSAKRDGGAVYNAGKLDVINSTLSNNTSEWGAAIWNSKDLTIDKSTISGNTAGTDGGAILNWSVGNLTVTDTNFVNNTAGSDGGAIFSNENSSITLTDANFINNTAKERGGAIYSEVDLAVNAQNSDVVFSGNSAADGNDIFMNNRGTTNPTVSLNAAEGKSITFASGISGTESQSGTSSYNITVNATDTDTNTGSVIINSVIKNAAISVENGTFHLSNGSALENSTLNMASATTLSTINNEISTFGDNITLPDNINLEVDVNVVTGAADNFSGVNSSEMPAITVTDINPIGAVNTTANSITVDVIKALGIKKTDNITISSELAGQTKTVLTPVRYLSGSVSEDGILTMAPTGKGYKDFNPSVMASPVAAQLGGYLTQLNSYDEAFRNMDMYMLMTKKQRMLMKNRNKYAISETPNKYYRAETPYEQTAGWVRPYATFEKVDLRGGPKVSNVAYGTFIGGESEMRDLGHGWDGMWGAYVGYNGSHQSFNGISTYQNGGTLGLVGMAYKDDFFTGLTINAGANAGEASTYYGDDNFSMLMAGIASKTGYNIELAEGKFIIQPSFLMSYSFVNTFDYTNAAGVRINSDPLNAIHIEPGLKFIGNLKNGWQPYLGVSMVWNIMDKTDFKANDTSLPDLSVKPYVKYGIGVRKTWGERMTGFLQCFFTNGGRNGVGLQAGFRWAIGKDTAVHAPSDIKVQLPKTQIKLSNNN